MVARSASIQGGPGTYVRREPERSVLHRVVRDGLPPLRATLAERDERGLPGFVERELQRFTECGALSAGFARFRCATCGEERLVALTCKGRGFCPSCLGRRMVAGSAHLVDRVLPHVPVRHWVLSLPFALRVRMAWDHELCRAVLRVFARALQASTRERTRAPDGAVARTGSTTVVQRFGSALNLNIHFHTLGLDGVFTEASNGELRFHAARAPTDAQIAKLLETVRTRIIRLLVRRGLVSAETSTPDADFDADAPPLAALYAASVQQLLATGERAGRRPRRVRSAASVPARAEHPNRHGARIDGFDLHASAAVRAKNRDRLERLCRYLLRPPVANERLSESDGLVLLALPRPWSDGTTHLAFTPTELVERLAALVPRPHANLVLYHGVLAAHARLRPRVVRFRRPRLPPADLTRASHGSTSRNPRWAELMRRGLDLDVLACARCGGRMTHIATILDPTVVRRILEHLGLAPPPPGPRMTRAPPPAPTPTKSPLRARLERLHKVPRTS